MKESSVAVWGCCSSTGHFDFVLYGAVGRRRFINALEGDAVLRAARAVGNFVERESSPNLYTYFGVYLGPRLLWLGLGLGLGLSPRGAR